MKAALSFLLLLLTGSFISAQDTHYWTQQFGTRSALMGGAVIGGVKNHSVIFYNPGGLGFIDTASLSINADAYTLENIKFENALGQKQDYKSDYLGSIPLLVGGIFRSSPDKKLKIAYGLINPVDFIFDATARIDTYQEIVSGNESPGPEEFIAQGSLKSRLKESVGAVGFSRQLNENWSVGISNYFIVRSMNMSRSLYTRMYLNNATNDLVSSSFVRELDFFNVRYQAKIGLAYEKKNFSAGITISAPSLNIFGSGVIAVDLIGNNMKIDNSRTDFLANDRQDKLKSKYKSPVSVSGGINWTANRNYFGLAVQYFGKVAAYDVMQAKPSAFVRPASLYDKLQSDQYLRVKVAAKNVLNVAIGYEHNLNEGVSITASFRTNNSYFDKSLKDEVGLKPEFTSWNIYHMAGGVTLSKGRNQLSLGLLYSFGSDKNRAIDNNLENPSEDNFLQGATTITKATYSSIGFLLGFTSSFRKF
jgi:hypothetical protein